MKVLDLSCDVAGRFAAKLLAMSGLEVVRPSADSASDPLTLYLDAHKTVVPAEAVQERLDDADVVFTSFDKGKYLGLAASLRVPSACVHVTTSTFGTTGPYSALRGGPVSAWSAGGYLFITGDPDREPLMGPEHLCAYVAGYTAAIAAEAALAERRHDGKGRHVDISAMEAMLCMHQSTFSRAAAGDIRQRTGRYTEVYPLVVRPCKDGHVSLGVVSDAEFDKLLIAIDRPDLAADARFAERAARWENRDALDREIDTFLSRHTGREAVEILQATGLAAAEVAGPAEILRNAQLTDRGFWDHPTSAPTASMPGNPIPPMRAYAAPAEERSAQAWTARGTGTALPLSGIRVLDFTAFWAGPSATRNLGDLGADVIWIEKPKSRIDWEPRVSDPMALQQHLYHTKMMRHKRSAVLDLERGEGRAAVQRLARDADVVVENFRPGTADKLGVGPAQLCAANPRLVYVSLSGWGSKGPWGDWRSYGPSIEAASSIEGRTGYRNGEPLRLGHTLPDGLGGLSGTLAALRGLRERERTGRGGWFDISQLEVVVAASGEDILAASLLGTTFPRIGNRARSGAIQGVFPCRGADQWVAIRLEDADDIARFATVTGVPIISAAQDLDTVERLIGGYTASRDKTEIARRLQDAGVEAFPVLDAAELLRDPQLAARGFFQHVAVEGGTFRVPGTPWHGLADPNGSAPRFGAHTAEILAMAGA